MPNAKTRLSRGSIQAGTKWIFIHLLLEDPGKVVPAETGKATRSGGRRDPQGTATEVPGHLSFAAARRDIWGGGGAVPVALVSWGAGQQPQHNG